MLFKKNSPDTPPRVELTVSFQTYFSAALFVGAIALTYFLFPVLLLLFLSVLIAITLTSLERFLMRHGWKRMFADTFLIVSLLAVLSVVMFVLIPAAVEQMKEVFHHWPQLEKQFLKMASPELRAGADKLINSSPGSINRVWQELGVVANNMLTGILKFGLMMIMAFYMLLEGPKAWAWILAFIPENHRERVEVTAREICPIVESYIVGQAITSTLAALWVFTTATVLDVPAAITLAVLAAVFDILPGLGFILNAATGGLMALTVSPEVGLIFIGSLLVYMLIENYLLVPYIYGSKLKLSPLVVLVSLILAGSLGGIPVMISILPVIASFGPIERHWFHRHEDLKETAKLHKRLEHKTATDLADPHRH